MNRTRNEYDALVIGSGPGGVSVARELSQKSKKVQILEWGDHDPVRGTALQAFPQLFTPGRSLFVTGQSLGVLRGVTTGGSSHFYCATALGTHAHKTVDDIRISLIPSYRLIINRTRIHRERSALNILQDLRIFGWIPEDDVIRNWDVQGHSFLDLPSCPALSAIKKCLRILIENAIKS